MNATPTPLAEMTNEELTALKADVTGKIRTLDRSMNDPECSRKDQLRMRESHWDLSRFRNRVDDEMAARGL